MIICVCAGTSSHDIDELLESGNSLDDIIAITESTMSCGTCANYLKEYVNMKRYHFENCRNKREL